MSDPNSNSAIEIYDSMLDSLMNEDQRVVLDLEPAYIHRSTGTPGVDPSVGWVQDIILLVDGTIEGSLTELPCDLWEGSLQVGDQKIENIIPLPVDYRGEVTLTLVTQSLNRVIVRGSAISANPIGEAKFIEEFSGVS